jgi:two-component system OmpR family response regulator
MSAASASSTPEAAHSAAGPTILAVDNEIHITELISMALGMRGMNVRVAHDGRSALAAVETQRPDMIILDVNMPELDGFEVARRLRQSEGASTRVPIIFLTARDTLDDRLGGLRLGADDYLTKPFSVEELALRVEAVLRRSRGSAGESTRLEFADLTLDEDTREVYRAGQLIELTPTEYKLLKYLLVNARRVLTREQILDHVWEYSFTTNCPGWRR